MTTPLELGTVTVTLCPTRTPSRVDTEPERTIVWGLVTSSWKVPRAPDRSGRSPTNGKWAGLTASIVTEMPCPLVRIRVPVCSSTAV